MTKRLLSRRMVVALALMVGAGGLVRVEAQAAAGAESEKAAPGILTREQAGAILPATVFYRGQSATIQQRNSSGIKLQDGRLVLATVVDTGGYSTAVQQTYQAYLITEVPVHLGGETLAAGAYGFGFVGGDKMVVMDLGGHEILHAKTTRDAGIARPNPLQIVAEAGTAGHYRLYMGRSFVSLTPDAK